VLIIELFFLILFRREVTPINKTANKEKEDKKEP